MTFTTGTSITTNIRIPLLLLTLFWADRCVSFSAPFGRHQPYQQQEAQQLSLNAAAQPQSDSQPTSQSDFLQSLDVLDTINKSSPHRSKLLDHLIQSKKCVDPMQLLQDKPELQDSALSIADPGLQESMATVAPGVWKVIYAPHLATLASLFGGGKLDVQYVLKQDGTIESHAKLAEFSWLNKDIDNIYLSTSGTYGSESNVKCFVQWDQAWIKLNPNINENQNTQQPYYHFDQVPDSFLKTIITRVGKLLFIRPFSVFPISYLNNELIVFDFELLGTRICARKQ